MRRRCLGLGVRPFGSGAALAFAITAAACGAQESKGSVPEADAMVGPGKGASSGGGQGGGGQKSGGISGHAGGAGGARSIGGAGGSVAHAMIGGMSGVGGTGQETAGGAGNADFQGGQGGGSFTGGAGTAPASVLFPLDCGGSYDQLAPWPGLGRCADRGGRLPDNGPTKWLSEKDVDLGTPITTSPVVSQDHVFVATTKGLFRLGRSLDSPFVRIIGSFASTPVLTSERVYALASDGRLHFANPSDDSASNFVDLKLPPTGDQPPEGPWTSSPALGEGILYVMSPRGDLVSVKLAVVPVVQERVSTAGAGTHGSVAIDGLRGVYLPMTVGVFRLRGESKVMTPLGTATVDQTPVGLPTGAVFSDVTGRLHSVSVTVWAEGMEGPAAHHPGSSLEVPPGGLASLGSSPDQSFTIGFGKSVQRITLNDADEKGPVIDSPASGPPFFTTLGPVVAAPAVDNARRQYIASSDGNLYIVDKDGALLDSFLTDGALVSQPALVPGGVYVGSSDGRLYFLSGTAGSSGNGGAGGDSGTGGQAGSIGNGASGGSAGSGGNAGSPGGPGGKAGSGGK